MLKIATCVIINVSYKIQKLQRQRTILLLAALQ